ncbi:hypothetical protein [Pseudomonas soli]|uniref:hypothetical protein n=1 Tax=Pseudomonas soli TaxID=1306993 RepID=UPI0015E8950C|nr:hypothetical protein [Pseudomonas soli]
MSRTLTIPLSRLSTDPQIRHGQLRDYFCDKDAVATQVGDQWSLSLYWSDDPYRYVDPRLDEGLAWWGGQLRYQDMSAARKRRGKVLLSLNDTWTLESWSEWLAKQPTSCKVVVLHVDDHMDLGAPRIFMQSAAWFDPIDNRQIDLLKPESITRAIHSGALGMGSFLTPFLHRYPLTDVRHLCQAPKCIGTIDSVIKLKSDADSLLNPSARRLAVSLEEDTPGAGRGRYRFTSDLDAWLEGLSASDAAILLHIDMDYFCNRYDGDSDHIEQPAPLDVSLPCVLLMIDNLIDALCRHNLLDRLADIVIAFSPGFFPAEFWKPSCDRLLSGLGEAPWQDR